MKILEEKINLVLVFVAMLMLLPVMVWAHGNYVYKAANGKLNIACHHVYSSTAFDMGSYTADLGPDSRMSSKKTSNKEFHSQNSDEDQIESVLRNVPASTYHCQGQVASIVDCCNVCVPCALLSLPKVKAEITSHEPIMGEISQLLAIYLSQEIRPPIS